MAYENPLQIRGRCADLDPGSGRIVSDVGLESDAAEKAYYAERQILGAMLLTEHNLSFYQQLMQAMRNAIAAGRFAAFAADFRRDFFAR